MNEMKKMLFPHMPWIDLNRVLMGKYGSVHKISYSQRVDLNECIKCQNRGSYNPDKTRRGWGEMGLEVVGLPKLKKIYSLFFRFFC